MSAVKASVILCTHNPREAFLSRVLAGLRQQTLPLRDWELLLLDNGSKDPLATRFDLTWHPHSRHIREDELGLTPARLRGIRESQADILVFVDDDTVLAPNYLEQALVVAGEWPFVGVWGGSVIPEYEVPLPDWVGNQSWRLTVVDVREDVWSNLREGFDTKPAGAGICIRARVAQHYLKRCNASKSHSTLGRKGTGLGGYEDMEIAQCAIDLGLGTARSTKLKLTHLIPQSRLTVDYFVRHAEGDAASYLAYRFIRGLPYRHLARHSWYQSLVWRLHCWKRRVPREQRLIHAAHLRGLRKGLEISKTIKTENNKT